MGLPKHWHVHEHTYFRVDGVEVIAPCGVGVYGALKRVYGALKRTDDDFPLPKKYNQNTAENWMKFQLGEAMPGKPRTLFGTPDMDTSRFPRGIVLDGGLHVARPVGTLVLNPQDNCLYRSDSASAPHYVKVGT